MERNKIKVNLDAERSGKKVLEVKGLSKTLAGRQLFAPFDLTILYGERVGIVGANGSGKTTLLKTLLEMMPPDTGTVKIGASVVVGYYSQEQETLPFDSTPLDFVRRLKRITEAQAIGVLRRLLFSYQDMHTTIGNLSGGEKSRLQIARLMLTEANFLLLDEPTNNLDIPSVEVLEVALEQFEGTILTVSHDRYFLDKIATHIIAIGNDQHVRAYPGNFSYYTEIVGDAFTATTLNKSNEENFRRASACLRSSRERKSCGNGAATSSRPSASHFYPIESICYNGAKLRISHPYYFLYKRGKPILYHTKKS